MIWAPFDCVVVSGVFEVVAVDVELLVVMVVFGVDVEVTVVVGVTVGGVVAGGSGPVR